MNKPAGNPGPGQSPQAKPTPINPAIIRRASEWMARLWSGEATDAERAACQQWRATHPDHERAWIRLQQMEDKLSGVPNTVARQALLQPALTAFTARRRTLLLLGLATATGGTAYAVRDSAAWQIAISDHSTRTGEIREIMLADGTRIVLNTATAIDVRFDEQQRRLILHSGEILVTTAADPASRHRPFLVQSQQGTVEALGTRFVVRQNNDASDVAVFAGAVRIRPHLAVGEGIRMDAGYRSSFTSEHVQPPVTATESSTAWVSGTLVAENMRLTDFVAELGRYRSGLLRCDPAIAEWRTTGVFSIRDTDRALLNLTVGLPVEVRYRTRYWVTVKAGSPPR